MKRQISCNVFTLSRNGKLFPGAPVVQSPTERHPHRLALTDRWETTGIGDPGLPIFADPSVVAADVREIGVIERARLYLTAVDLKDFPEDERLGKRHGRGFGHQLANLQPLARQEPEADPTETLIWIPFPVNVSGGLGGCDGRGATPLEPDFEEGRQLGDYRCLLLALGGKLGAVALTIKGGESFFLRAIPDSQISAQVPCPCVSVCTREEYNQSRRDLEAAFNLEQAEKHFFAKVTGLGA